MGTWRMPCTCAVACVHWIPDQCVKHEATVTLCCTSVIILLYCRRVLWFSQPLGAPQVPLGPRVSLSRHRTLIVANCGCFRAAQTCPLLQRQSCPTVLTHLPQPIHEWSTTQQHPHQELSMTEECRIAC